MIFTWPLAGELPILTVMKMIVFGLIVFASLVSHAVPTAPHKKHTVEKAPAEPNALISQRTQRVLALLKSRPVRARADSFRELTLSASATKTGFLDALYSHKLVEASWATEMLSDKRVFSEVLSRELGATRAQEFYPKTLGLREFLTSHGFVNANGSLKKDEAEQIEAALYEEFPSGFIARAAVGVAPTETTLGLFKDTDAFMVELLRPETPLYQPSHASAAVSSHLLNGQVTSGEAVVLQENLTAAADAKKPLKLKTYQDVRIHTYEGDIVANAIPARWVQRDLLNAKQLEDAQAFVQTFLKTLSPSIVSRQAWGIDVAVFDNGEMRINDIVTNHGQRVAWSSYLDQPRVIEAYAKHFDQVAGVRFAGFSGWMINHGFANYFPYWERRIDKAHGFGKVLAYLPPWP
jgi:hypothetical protein